MPGFNLPSVGPYVEALPVGLCRIDWTPPNGPYGVTPVPASGDQAGVSSRRVARKLSEHPSQRDNWYPVIL